MLSELTGWKRFLDGDVYNRLCACSTIKTDIKPLVDAKWRFFKETGKDAEGYIKEDALCCILELLESNSRDFDITHDEYNELKRD